MRVFIVEDSILVQERLVDLATGVEGVEIVGQGDDVVESIKAIRELRPDVVILDLQLRGGSGLDVLDAIKSGDRPPAAIVLTNYPYPQYQKRAREKGAEYFFDKSSEFHKVPDALREIRLKEGQKGWNALYAS
jgi:DNA-binding NarL/FixJ family response regulator